MERRFWRDEPGRLWVTDITEHPTREGKVYCAVVLDVFSRRVVRWSIDASQTAALVTNALVPFALLAGIEGRQEEVLTLGGVTVHPNVFHGALERLPVAGWQVIDEGDRLRVLLASGENVDAALTADLVQRALAAVGVRGVQVTVNLVDSIPRTALGKAPLIRRAQLAAAGH